MGQSSVKGGNLDVLNAVTSLAATTGALQHTLLALAACHGGKGGDWLDRLEAKLVRDTKNIVFNGTSIDAEVAAVECALATIRNAVQAVRKQLS